MRYRWYRRKARPGASEPIGAVLAIAITLVVGSATWSYVRSQAVTSEGALQTNFGATNNFLNEQFKVTDMYFGSSTSTTFWLYNIGTLTVSVLSVRVYDSAGLVNLLYNYTVSGGTKTDQVYDLRSSLATKCKTASAAYETPRITVTTVKATNAQAYAFTVPPTQSSCPSYGQTFTAGTTYNIVVTGLYGNVITYSQTK